MQGFTFGSVPVTGELTPELRGFTEAVRLGFGAGHAPDASHERLRAQYAADGWRLDAAYAPASPLGEIAQPVGTFASATLTTNTGGGHLEPTSFITNITVRTTHRRRGLLRQLMNDGLRRARADGLTLAALTATEGSIYGRFGFGVSTVQHRMSLNTGPRLEWTREFEPRVALVDAGAFATLRADVFDRFHAARRGSHARPAFHEDLYAHAWDDRNHRPNAAINHAAHWDAAGRADGFLTYEIDRDADTARVRDLVALDPEVELALFQYIGAVDLVETATFDHLSPSSPLRWALVDPRQVSIAGVSDFTWLRILDTPGALGVRAFDTDGIVDLTVNDPLGLAAGSWRLAVRQGRAELTPSTRAALQVDARALASLYFGLADARKLAVAGQVHGPVEDVAALARLFRTDEPPYSVSEF